MLRKKNLCKNVLTSNNNVMQIQGSVPLLPSCKEVREHARILKTVQQQQVDEAETNERDIEELTKELRLLNASHAVL